MLKSLKLHGVGPVEDLSAFFGDRLNVLTGDNGLGKTFLLDVCFWALTGTWPGGRTALDDTNGTKDKPRIVYGVKGKGTQSKGPKTASFDFHSQTWTRPKGRPFMPGLVIYAAVDGGFSVWDPARNYWRDPTTGAKEGTEQPRAYQFSPRTLANGLIEDHRTLCNGLIRDWVDWQYQGLQKAIPDRIRPTTAGQPLNQPAPHGRPPGPLTDPFHLLESVVAALSHPDEPMEVVTPKRIFVDDTRAFPTIHLPYRDVAFPHWAAGMKRVLSFAYLLVWSWTEHVQASELRREKPTDRIVMIVDEIEAHLHPKWQRTILPAVLGVADQISAGVEVQFWVATHSPLVLASIEPHFDEERDSLFLFKLDRTTKEVSFRPVHWAMQGDAVGWLTSSVFGLDQARSKEAEIAIEAAEAFMRGDSASLRNGLRTKDQIHRELVRVLAGQDPFWPRWIVHVKAGKP